MKGPKHTHTHTHTHTVFPIPTLYREERCLTTGVEAGRRQELDLNPNHLSVQLKRGEKSVVKKAGKEESEHELTLAPIDLIQ